MVDSDGLPRTMAIQCGSESHLHRAVLLPPPTQRSAESDNLSGFSRTTLWVLCCRVVWLDARTTLSAEVRKRRRYSHAPPDRRSAPIVPNRHAGSARRWVPCELTSALHSACGYCTVTNSSSLHKGSPIRPPIFGLPLRHPGIDAKSPEGRGWNRGKTKAGTRGALAVVACKRAA